MSTTEIEYVTKDSQLRKRKSWVIEAELAKLYKEDGRLTPELLLERAADEGHPLHPFFEWDDSAAAEKYRKIQAYSILITSKFVCLLSEQRNGERVIVEAIPERKFLPESRGGGFKMRNEVLGEKDGRAAFAERKLAELRSWLRSIADIPEMTDLRSKITKIVGKK
jgi:hypothetical protein